MEALLLRAGLNPNSLARKLDEDPPLMNKVIRGLRTPSDRLIEKLSVEFGVPVKTLEAWRDLDVFEKEKGKFEEKLKTEPDLQSAYQDLIQASGSVTITPSVYGHATVTPPLQERLSQLADQLLAGYNEPLYIPCDCCDGSASITMNDLATKEEFITVCTKCGSPLQVKSEDIAIFRQTHEVIENFRAKMQALRPKDG